MPTSDNKRDDIRTTLELDQDAQQPIKRRWFLLAIVIIVINIALFSYIRHKQSSAITYETKPLTIGDLKITVSATGNLEPTNTVNVGTELSGTVEIVYVDENDQVAKGDMLAQLDTNKLDSKVASSNAILLAARATLKEAEVSAADAKNELDRAKQMRDSSGGRLPSDQEFDALQAAYDRSIARVENSKAQVKQARSALTADEDDLSKANIVSPIDGIILVRNIEPGQTVAAALQTPVLFTIAENLSQMDLIVSIDEADIGTVSEGQHAIFTVDAYPDQQFEATINKVKLDSEIIDGVVTYQGTLKVDNSTLMLRPGMTATSEITVREIQNALLVPNAALRYRPSEAAEEAIDDAEYVWIMHDGEAAKIRVYPQGTDGTHTAVQSDRLLPGQNVIIGEKQLQK